MPRYSAMESIEMISALSRGAISIARRDLPEPVGPVNTRAFWNGSERGMAADSAGCKATARHLFLASRPHRWQGSGGLSPRESKPHGVFQTLKVTAAHANCFGVRRPLERERCVRVQRLFEDGRKAVQR